MERELRRFFKIFMVFFILLAICSTAVMAYEWTMWRSLGKSQYPAGSSGEATITLQNTGTTLIHIKKIL